jgi:hypothetical protein
MGQAASTEEPLEPSISGSSDHGEEEGNIKSASGEVFRSTEEDNEQIPSVSLESLTDEQLRFRLDGIQREDILEAGLEISQPTMTESSISMANRILDLSPELNQLRFKLVPSRIKEDVFWQAVFSILRERGNKVQYRVDNVPPKELSRKPLRRMESGNPSVVDELRQTLARRDQEIARLHRQLNEMKRKLAIMKASSSNSNVVKEENKTYCCHKGKWIMDKDSLEFLALPEELKSNLRRERHKRLEQVRSTMKFILESDNVQDSHGSWDCCGQTSYTAQGCGIVSNEDNCNGFR